MSEDEAEREHFWSPDPRVYVIEPLTKRQRSETPNFDEDRGDSTAPNGEQQHVVVDLLYVFHNANSR